MQMMTVTMNKRIHKKLNKIFLWWKFLSGKSGEQGNWIFPKPFKPKMGILSCTSCNWVQYSWNTESHIYGIWRKRQVIFTKKCPLSSAEKTLPGAKSTQTIFVPLTPDNSYWMNWVRKNRSPWLVVRASGEVEMQVKMFLVVLHRFVQNGSLMSLFCMVALVCSKWQSCQIRNPLYWDICPILHSFSSSFLQKALLLLLTIPL